MRVVILDTGPLGLVTNPNASPINLRCHRWLREILARGDLIVVPEIADYELRRELLRAGLVQGIGRLDALESALHYAPITTAAMKRAAELWAQVRNQGMPTAHDRALDGDVILAEQAEFLGDLGDEIVIATTNVGHLSLFGDARNWQDISPQAQS